MKIFKYFSIAFCCIGGFCSCEQEHAPYLKLRDANVYFDLNTSRFNPSVMENVSKLKVPVILAGIPGTLPVTVIVATDTTGHEHPALEGVDYTIKEKTLYFEDGYGVQYIDVRPINREDRQPTRTFDLVIQSTDPELLYNPDHRITVSILDAGHPLLYMCGDYLVTARDIVWTGQVVDFSVQITPDPDDDNAVYIENVPLVAMPGTLKFRMRVDADAGMCYIDGQECGDFELNGVPGGIGLYYSYTYINPEDGEEYFDYDTEGVIKVNYLNGGKKFQLRDLIGAYVISGQYKGKFFFLYEDMVLNRMESPASAQSLPAMPAAWNYENKLSPLRR